MKTVRCSNKEYTKSMLPQTRLQIFWDVVKLHWWELLSLGLLIFVFSIPLQVSTLYGDVYVGNLNNKMMEATDEQRKQLVATIISFDNIRAWINVGFFAILGVGLAGILRVIRQYAWECNVSLRGDFALGVKQNARQVIALVMFVGVGFALATMAYNMSSQTSGAVSLVFMLPVGVMTFALLPLCFVACICCSIYSNKLINNVKIALATYFSNLFKCLLAFVCCAVLAVPLFVPNIYCHLIGGAVLSIVSPFVLLGLYLFTLNLLDDVVNRHRHPELVNKGLFLQ